MNKVIEFECPKIIFFCSVSMPSCPNWLVFILCLTFEALISASFVVSITCLCFLVFFVDVNFVGVVLWKNIRFSIMIRVIGVSIAIILLLQVVH